MGANFLERYQQVAKCLCMYVDNNTNSNESKHQLKIHGPSLNIHKSFKTQKGSQIGGTLKMLSINKNSIEKGDFKVYTSTKTYVFMYVYAIMGVVLSAFELT